MKLVCINKLCWSVTFVAIAQTFEDTLQAFRCEAAAADAQRKADIAGILLEQQDSNKLIAPHLAPLDSTATKVHACWHAGSKQSAASPQ